MPLRYVRINELKKRIASRRTISSGSSGIRVMVPEPSRSICCSRRRITYGIRRCVLFFQDVFV